MSYDVSFIKNGATVQFPHKHQIAGGTYALGGTKEASLNITYNYTKLFAMAFNNPNGIHILQHKPLFEAIPELEDAIARLKDEKPDDNYWRATEGNARVALQDLLELAKMTECVAPTAFVNIT